MHSLFQAPRETREGESEGTKTTGVGERKRGKEEEPVIILLKNLIPPTFSKMCQHVKMSNFSLSGFRVLTRVLEFARLSLHRFDVADTERFSGFEISTLKILQILPKKFDVSWNESFPGVLVQRRSK